MKIAAAQIGRAGELLVQSRLLRFGIESSQMTTDTGIDLVAYAPGMEHPVTIQVKTQLWPTAAGGKGKLMFDWAIPRKCPADHVALVDLKAERIWLIPTCSFEDLSHEQGPRALRMHMYTDPTAKPRTPGLHFDHEFDEYLLEVRAGRLSSTSPPARASKRSG